MARLGLGVNSREVDKCLCTRSIQAGLWMVDWKVWPCAADLKDMEDVLIGLHLKRCGISLPSHVLKASSKAITIE